VGKSLVVTFGINNFAHLNRFSEAGFGARKIMSSIHSLKFGDEFLTGKFLDVLKMKQALKD